MSAESDPADILWNAAEHGVVERREDTLPAPILRAMQDVIDSAVAGCVHVRAALDLPPGALEKYTVASVPMIVCASDLTCVADLWMEMRVQRLSPDARCAMCDRPKADHRVLFRDEPAALTMLAFVCRSCARGPLARWAGVTT